MNWSPFRRRSRRRAASTAQIFIDALHQQSAERQFEEIKGAAYYSGYHDALIKRPFDPEMVDRVNDFNARCGLPRHYWYAALPKWARTL